MQELEHERDSWLASQQQMHKYIEDLMTEKEEMIRSHTVETGELRKKNAVLAEQAQKLESISMSTVPSSTGYSTDFSEFDHLTMETSPWDNFSMVNDFSMETDLKQENSLVISSKKERPSSKDEEKTATSGLLLMLLLCGAWVASSSNTAAPPSIPTMPEDVRVASAVVLENIYKDAGLSSVRPLECSNSNGIRRASTQSSAFSASPYASMSRSPLSTLHHRLITPSEQQQRDTAFSLSASQYNGITSDELYDDHVSPTSNRRRNLGEALAAMRHGTQGSAAEVYTRSLMWDEVPTKVVRDFARMVAESKSATTRSGITEPIS